jgi:hypothetical protein
MPTIKRRKGNKRLRYIVEIIRIIQKYRQLIRTLGGADNTIVDGKISSLSSTHRLNLLIFYLMKLLVETILYMKLFFFMN